MKRYDIILAKRRTKVAPPLPPVAGPPSMLGPEWEGTAPLELDPWGVDCRVCGARRRAPCRGDKVCIPRRVDAAQALAVLQRARIAEREALQRELG